MSRYKAYSEYRDSGIDWNEEIPSHWTTSKIRYMFSFDKGLTITKENLQDDGIPCVNYGEVHSRYGFEVNPTVHSLKCVSEQYLEVSASSLLKKGDFVFADTSEDIDGSGNFTQLVSDDVTFAGYHTIIVRPYDRRSSRFYAYLFDSKELRTQIRHAVKGVKVFSITQAILRGIDIWLPTLQERERIANFLDHETAKIDTLIAKQQELIKLLKEKRQAVISHAVTKGLNPNAPMRDSGVEWLGEVPAHWAVVPLKNIIRTRKGAPFRADDFCESGVPVVKASDIKQLTIRSSNVFLPVDFVNIYERARLSSGDIILSTVGSNPEVRNSAVGQIGMVPVELDGALLNQNTVVFDPDEVRVDRNYLFSILQMNGYRDHLDLNAHGTANQSSLNISDMLDFSIPLPQIKEQSEIAKFISERNNQLIDLEKYAMESESLLFERRTALISAAVTGKIDVRDWQPPSESAIAA